MYSVGLDLAGIDNRVVVKLPVTDAGVEAAALLKKQGVLVTLTGRRLSTEKEPGGPHDMRMPSARSGGLKAHHSAALEDM